MKYALTAFSKRCVLFLILITASNAQFAQQLPYKSMGIDEQEAVAHLLNRLTYGATPDDIAAVIEKGPEKWLGRQLAAEYSDDDLEKLLSHLQHRDMSTLEIYKKYPLQGQLVRQATAAGVLENPQEMDAAERRRIVREFAESKGYRPVRQLLGELMTQKLALAVFSKNQLREVLTDFWFNHFNVSVTNNRARPAVATYERDAIRPHVLGHFRDMLEATAKHPAMLLYLDNARSVAPDSVATTMDMSREKMLSDGSMNRRAKRRMERQAEQRRRRMENMPNANRRPRGVNENYARELLELHTLGVDGGYTQGDVEEVARAFTGWTHIPVDMSRGQLGKRVAEGERFGFVRQGDFLFRADQHDSAEKMILNRSFPAGQGIAEGEMVLNMLAEHPSTSRHISRKLAVRFVTDEPSEKLVEQLAGVFQATNGDIAAVLKAIIYSEEFWHADNRRSKIKSPFELTVSALRVLDADVKRPRFLLRWIQKMGQPLYAYQAPTGYPDRAQAWINTGALLNRMNFGLSLAMGKVRGVDVDIMALNQNREPESLEAALRTFAPLLMPGRELSETYDALIPVIHDPQFARKVSEATANEETSPTDDLAIADDEPGDIRLDMNTGRPQQLSAESLRQVVGVILGSPEFQRR